MSTFNIPVEIRWSDLDPNFHLRHSAYYDFGAYCRMSFLTKHGCTPEVMLQYKLGPILFREECVFRKEIHFGDEVQINLKLKKATADFSRWTMQHEIWKAGNKLSAIITIDGAWIDTVRRKLISPPAFILNALDVIPKSEDYELI